MPQYRVQAKVKDFGSNNYKLVTYKTTNLRSFAFFLDKTFKYWTYLNVYEYVSHQNGRLLQSYTRDNPPRLPHLS